MQRVLELRLGQF